MINLTQTVQYQLRAPDAAVTPDSNGRIEGDLDCQWQVLSPPGKVIRLQFTQIDMTDSGCTEDYIEVRVLTFSAVNFSIDYKFRLDFKGFY